MHSNNKLGIRLLAYVVGLFIMTIGIALSVRSDLGVSPVSSIPYTLTCVAGIEMGNATILFHIVLVVFQMLLLRRDFKVASCLQVVVGILFGKFTTLSNALAAAFLPATDNLAVRFGMLLVSVVLVAIGIFFYMPANIMPLAGEGVMQAVSQVTGVVFARVKIGFDVTMVVISFVVCMAVIHSLGSVGIGTIVAAVLVGVTLGLINRRFGKWRNRLLGVTLTGPVKQEAQTDAG